MSAKKKTNSQMQNLCNSHSLNKFRLMHRNLDKTRTLLILLKHETSKIVHLVYLLNNLRVSVIKRAKLIQLFNLHLQ